MKTENNKLIIDGNAFYELDLDCVRKRQELTENRKLKNNVHPAQPEKRQRK